MNCQPRLRTRRSSAVALCVFVAAAFLAACGSDDAGGSPGSTSSTTDASETTSERSGGSSTSSSTETTSTTEASTTTSSSGETSTPPESTEGADVIDRYIGYWDARFDANAGTPNPASPDLAEYATGAQLATVIAETQSNLDDGLAFERPTDPHDFQRVTVIELEDDHAVVQECVVSDGVVVRRETGEVVNDEVATHNVQGELDRVGGVWKVAAVRLVQTWEGVAGCALVS